MLKQHWFIPNHAQIAHFQSIFQFSLYGDTFGIVRDLLKAWRNLLWWIVGIFCRVMTNATIGYIHLWHLQWVQVKVRCLQIWLGNCWRAYCWSYNNTLEEDHNYGWIKIQLGDLGNYVQNEPSLLKSHKIHDIMCFVK